MVLCGHRRDKSLRQSRDLARCMMDVRRAMIRALIESACKTAENDSRLETEENRRPEKRYSAPPIALVTTIMPIATGVMGQLREAGRHGSSKGMEPLRPGWAFQAID